VGVLEEPNIPADWLAFVVVVEAIGKGGFGKPSGHPTLVSLALGTVVEAACMGGAGNPSGHPVLCLP
jgi:hypothetical protein